MKVQIGFGSTVFSGGIKTAQIFGFESAIMELPNWEKVNEISMIAEKHAVEPFIWLSGDEPYRFKKERAEVICKLQCFEGTVSEKAKILSQYVRSYVEDVAAKHYCRWILKPNGYISKIDC